MVLSYFLTLSQMHTQHIIYRSHQQGIFASLEHILWCSLGQWKQLTKEIDFPNGFQNPQWILHSRIPNGLSIPESPMDSLHICISIHNPCVWLCSVVCRSLQPHVLQHTRFLYPWDFPQQEYWNGLLLPPPGDLLDPRIQNKSPESPALAGGFFTTEPLGKPMVPIRAWNFHSICRRLMLLPWSYGILWPADKQSYQ